MVARVFHVMDHVARTGMIYTIFAKIFATYFMVEWSGEMNVLSVVPKYI